MDLIDKKAVFEMLCEDCMIKYHGECSHPASRCIEYRKINQIPTIEAEPVKHGRWIPTDRLGGMDWYCCNACSQYNATYRSPFCPNCGARMDGGADNGS